MGFNHFICTPGIFDNVPPRTFESGPGLWGFLRSAKSYVINDPTFGLVGCGCTVESSPGQRDAQHDGQNDHGRDGQNDDQIVVTLKDGVRKRLRFVDDKIDFEVTQGEIVRATWDKPRSSFELEMEDTTGLVKTAALSIAGLPEGDYKVSHGHSSRAADGSLAIEAPIADARHLRITKA